MIDTKDLRIGNLLEVYSNIWTVDSILPDELYFKENDQYNHILNANPIPITKEWLVKFGFEKFSGSNNTYSIDNTIDIQFGLISVRVFIYPNKTSISLWHIKYIHQLQNLFKSLTQTELTYSNTIETK